LLTPTDDEENNDKDLKSDAPCREIPPFLRLRRCRGMRHTGIVGIALTGCVSTQQLLSQLPASREKIYIFPAASRPVVSHSGDVPSPETPRHINVKKKSPIAIDIITVCRYNIIKAGEYYEHQ
ncbi:MAG: hypothetical protein J6112_00630, partial [Clostridia bacterium]|nr:hypothetical protein [Clostridia bacterium]